VVIGFAGMAFNIVLILGFQTVFGYLYEWIGVALGAFMVGIAGGSSLLTRFSLIHKTRIVMAALLFLIILTSTFLTSLLTILARSHSLILFFILVTWSGALLGGSFPVLCHLYSKFSGQIRGATIYAADLAGGALSALLVSGILIPLFGFHGTLVLSAMMSGACLLAVFLVKS
jgi:spermidine synthase